MAQSFTKSVPLDTDVTLSGDSNGVTPSQHATKTYVDNKIAAIPAPYPGIGIMGQDEGVPLGTGTVMNFVGGGVVASISGTIIQVTVPPEFENFWNSGTAGISSIRAKNAGTVDATGDYSFATGFNTFASGSYSIAEGILSIARGVASHAEGNSSIARGTASHAEGFSNLAFADNSHAEGNGTFAYGESSHAEGNGSLTSGIYSFAGGDNNHAIGIASAALGGNHNRVAGVNSVILGGSGTNTIFNDTVFVPNLNIRYVQSGTAVTNLGIDNNGNIVTGTPFSTAGLLTGSYTLLDGRYFLSGTINPTILTGTYNIQFLMGNGTTVVPTGAVVGGYHYVEVPAASVVESWSMLSDATGSITVNILRSTNAGFPPTASLAGLGQPKLTNQRKNSANVTGTTSLAAQDILLAEVVSATTVKISDLSLRARRT